MSLNALLPFFSAAIMAVFVVFIFQRFFSKRRKSYHLLIWGIGLVFYLIGSAMEAIHTVIGWNALVFRVWYLFGAVLVAAWLGQGTVELLVRKRIGKLRLSRIILAVLAFVSVYAVFKVFTAELQPIMIADEVVSISTSNGFDEEAVLHAAASALMGTELDDDGELSRSLAPVVDDLMAEAVAEGVPATAPTSVSYDRLPGVVAEVDGQQVALSVEGDVLNVSIDGQPAGALMMAVGSEMHGHAIVSGGTRVLTPFFNVYGLITLVGGAIYSAYIFLRKRIMPNRVIGNVLIATGALMPGIGGLLSRFGMGGYLYLGELLGAILIFAGFIAATNKPETAEVPQPAVVK